jgi:GntR family transcriptional repressor for pyruvate dehydrogenase complex
VRRSAKTHRMILDMIKAGDADRAGELWSRHLKQAEEYVLASSEMSTVVDLLQ